MKILPNAYDNLYYFCEDKMYLYKSLYLRVLNVPKC